MENKKLYEDTNTLFDESFGANFPNFHIEDIRSPGSFNQSKTQKNMNSDKSTILQGVFKYEEDKHQASFVHKSSFYYMRKTLSNKEISKTVVPKHKPSNNISSIKQNSLCINGSSGKFSQNEKEAFGIPSTYANMNDSKSNNPNKRLIINPFDSINQSEVSKEAPDMIESNNNKNSSTDNMIYEAPVFSNNILNQLKVFNPNDEAMIINTDENINNNHDKKYDTTYNFNHSLSPIILNNADSKLYNKTSNTVDLNSLNLNYDAISVFHNNCCSSSSSGDSINQDTQKDNLPQTEIIENISVDSITNNVHLYQSIPIKESETKIKDRLVKLVNNEEFGHLPLKVNTIGFCHFTEMIVTEDKIINEKIEAEFYDNLQCFAVFENISKKVHKKIIYDEQSNVTNKKPIDDLKLCLFQDLSYDNQISDISKDIVYYRDVLCDGDGFYRSFAYGLIEQLILSHNLIQLQKTFYGIAITIKDTFKYNNAIIDKQMMIIILKIILTHVENNQLFEAYRVFTNAFINIRDFSLGLIKYIKISIAIIIKLNFNKLSELDKTILFPKEYFSKDNKFALDEYVNERILQMNKEPEDCIFYFAAITFKVNLKLIAFQKNKLFKHTFQYDYSSDYTTKINKAQRKQQTICLVYTYSRYHIGYSKIDLKHKDTFNYNNIILHQKKAQQKRFTNIRKKIYCHNCNSESDEICLRRFNAKQVCKQCLIIALRAALSLLCSYYVKDNYNHQEYYCKPITIKLDTNKHEGPLLFYDEDILELLGKTIPNYIISMLVIECSDCKQIVSFESSSKIIQLQCKCYICHDCFIKKINTGLELAEFNNLKRKTWKNRLSLNRIKPSLLQINCNCESSILPSFIISILYNNSKSSEPMHKLYLQFLDLSIHRCCLCGKETENNLCSIPNNNQCSHVICTKCKTAVLSESNNINKCIFCNEDHSFPFCSPKERNSKFCTSKDCCLIF